MPTRKRRIRKIVKDWINTIHCPICGHYLYAKFKEEQWICLRCNDWRTRILDYLIDKELYASQKEIIANKL